MSEEKTITLCGETWEVSIWERYIKNTKRDSAQIHEFLHKYGIGKGQAGKEIVPILITAFEASLATIQAQQANLQIAADMLAEERAKVAHRDELLRIQGEACERYKVALEEALHLFRDGKEVQAFSVLDMSLWRSPATEETEAAPATEPSPKFKVGDRVRIKETGQTAIIIETNIFGLHFFDTNATGLRGGFYDSDLRYEESESE